MQTGDVTIPVGAVKLAGELTLPNAPVCLVLFAHGSGSSRRSPRNQLVARILQREHVATLLFDLLTAEEEQSEAGTGHLRFNIPFLAERLIGATRWALESAKTRELAMGYFGSSTGAAAALMAAAELRETIGAVVSRGGRPDLAGDALEQVAAPTLLIVGGNDGPVIALNEEAYSRLHGAKDLRIVAGASHLFEEKGTLELAAEIAAQWFARSLCRVAQRA